MERWSGPSEPVSGHSSMGEQLMLVCETHVCLHQSGSHSWFEMGNQYKMPGSHHEMTYASSCNSARRKLNFFFFTLKHQVVPRRLARFPGSRDGLGPGQRQQTALLLGCWHPLALEEKEATHSRILAWRIPMDRGAWRTTVHGAAESDTT